MAVFPPPRSLASRLWRRVRPPRSDEGVGAGEIGDVDPATLAAEESFAFRCNLCGSLAHASLATLGREAPSCPGCGSTVRFRAIAHLVVREVLGRTAMLRGLPPRPGIAGIGLSDAACYAAPLARAFGYRNTWFHDEPRLDITAIDPALRSRHDFVIASDVFEHVAPPVSRAFDNALALLKPGGSLVLTVPFSLDADTVEHYPELHDWKVERMGGAWRVINRTRDGREQRFDAPVFHGGPGTTLEMRLFSRDALLRELERAGFADVRIAAEPFLPFGVCWREPWSVPIVARRTK